MDEVSLDQFLFDLRDMRRLRDSWSYTWVLGSGAAASAGIPTGRMLAQRWLREIFEIRHRGATELDFASWDAAAELGLRDVKVDCAPFYGALYKLRFGHQPRLGQDFLRSQMLGINPSYGYAALAQLQTESSHQYAVTTNFDHLLEEAYKRYLDGELVVCATDDQASTVQRLPNGPLLAKIHGDIFHETKNDASYIAELRDAWHDPLRTLFKRSAPLFVGYGGNDPGFMQFLTQEVRQGWFPHRPVWAYHEKSGQPAGELITRLAAQHDVMFVPIPGFDEFLFLVAEALELKPLTKRLEAEFASRVRAYHTSYETMASSLRVARPQEGVQGGALDRSLAAPDRRDWWEWREAAKNTSTYAAGLKVLQDGLSHLPESPELRSYYAAYRAQANPQDPEAETIACKALDDAEKQYGAEHPATLSCVHHLALLLAEKGDRAAAEPLYRRAFDTRERVLGPEHPDTLTSLNGLANLLAEKGDRAAAEPLYRRALETQERVLGPEHPDTLTSLNNLAILLSEKGDRAAAESLYRRALETQERVLGPEHPETLRSLNNLANLLSDKGDRAAAEPLCRRAFDSRERILGPEHPDTLKSLNNLANLLFTKGDRAAAESLYRRTLETQERVLGPEHPETLGSLNNFANLLSAKGDHAAAEALYRRALEASERVLGPTHVETARLRNNLARLVDAVRNSK